MGNKEKILIVDNHVNILELFTKLLTEFGFEPLCASDDQKGMEILMNCPVDLVITDIEMPPASGFDLVKSVKKVYPDMPVIMISSYANKKMEKRALQVGALGLLAKPFHLSKLQHLIGKGLAMRSLT
jgi:DNA-binding NtrC family response regulator